MFSFNAARYIQINNLTLQTSRKTALLIRDSKHIHITNTVINNAGRHGINISGGNNVSIENSIIHDTALGGILLKGGSREKLVPAQHLTSNNIIYQTNQILKTFSQPIVVSGVGNTVNNNLVFDVPYVGIRIMGNNHLVEHNELHHTCQQSSDCGAIYVGGDWTYRGNKIKHNKIHDIYGYGLINFDIASHGLSYGSLTKSGVKGLFLDNGASGTRVNNNIVYRVAGIALHLAAGRDNYIDNNIFISNDEAIRISLLPRWFNWQRKHFPELKKMPVRSQIWQQQYPRLAKPTQNLQWPEGNHIEKNIIVSTHTDPSASPFRYDLPQLSTNIKANLIWHNSGSIRVEAKFLDNPGKRQLFSWENWQSQGMDKGSVIADPQFINYSQDNFNLGPNSPAYALGFTIPPLSRIGIDGHQQSKLEKYYTGYRLRCLTKAPTMEQQLIQHEFTAY